MVTIIEKGRILSRKQVATLGCFAWSRLNGCWDEPSEAIDCIASWLVGTCNYFRLRTDLTQAPKREDFPGWRHNGNGEHERVAKLYWNWFYARYQGTLHFSDSPDFSGTLEFPGEPVRHFWGDIGEVSPSTFSLVNKVMGAGDLWITIVNEYEQTIIEPYISLQAVWQAQCSALFGNRVEEARIPAQLTLFQ